MNILPNLAAAATALMLGSATTATDALAPETSALAGIEWTVAAANGPRAAPTLEFEYRSNNSTFTLDVSRPDLAEVRAALAAPAPNGVTFTIEREPGTVACRGTLEGSYEGRGACTFAVNRVFQHALVARKLAPSRKEDLLAMALLGANSAMIDGFVRQGVAPRSADDVIAAAALGVNPDYVGGLKAAGLALDKFEDAIAAKALEIDAAYVRAMADAGFQSDVAQIIAMKATGVTPEYARRMHAAAQN